MLRKRVKQNTVVWLTVAMFALPVTPASACICSTGSQASSCCRDRRPASQSESQHGCCSKMQPRSNCSQAEHSTSTYCKGTASSAPPSHDWSRGGACCCKSERRPPRPIEPLLQQENSPNRTLGADSLASPSAAITLPAVPTPAFSNVAPIAPAGSLERCIFLSRFRL